MARQCIGLDIGSSSVKAVQLRKKGAGWALQAFGMQPLVPQTIVDGTIMDQTAVVEAIRAAGESIQALNGKLRDAQKQDVQLAKDLGFGNTLDLFVDMAGGFMGAFTSYLNMQKLDEAVDKMTGILDTVGKMQTEVGAGLRAIQTP